MAAEAAKAVTSPSITTRTGVKDFGFRDQGFVWCFFSADFFQNRLGSHGGRTILNPKPSSVKPIYLRPETLNYLEVHVGSYLLSGIAYISHLERV